MSKAVLWFFILCAFLASSCGSNTGSSADDGDGANDFMTPKVTSTFFLNSDDGILNIYAYDLGLNTISLLEPNWRSIETTRGDYGFTAEDFSNLESYNGYKLLRLSLFDHLWCREQMEDWIPDYIIECLFGQTTVPETYEENDDLELEQKPQVFESYFEFVEATLSYVQSLGIDLDLILLEVEFSSWTVSTRYGNTNGADYLKQLTGRVRPYFPQARIAILLVSTELSTMYVENPDACPGGDELCHGNGPEHIRLGVSQFVQKMIDAQVDFDAIGIRFTPDYWEDDAQASDYEGFIDTLSQFEKEIFIWAVWFAADASGTEGHHVHTEATQSQEFLDFMRVNLANPLVIGVDVSLFDYEEYNTRKNVGLVNALNSQKEDEGLPVRESYDDFKAFWESNHPQ